MVLSHVPKTTQDHLKMGFTMSLWTKVLSSMEKLLTIFWLQLCWSIIQNSSFSVSIQSWRLLKRWSQRNIERFYLSFINSVKYSGLFHGLVEHSLLIKLLKHLMTLMTNDSVWKSTSAKKNFLIFLIILVINGLIRFLDFNLCHQ